MFDSRGVIYRVAMVGESDKRVIYEWAPLGSGVNIKGMRSDRCIMICVCLLVAKQCSLDHVCK